MKRRAATFGLGAAVGSVGTVALAYALLVREVLRRL